MHINFILLIFVYNAVTDDEPQKLKSDIVRLMLMIAMAKQKRSISTHILREEIYRGDTLRVNAQNLT
jgi:hypothetical protein